MDLLVSVIIPVYNVEKYLKECVDSVINQTYSNLQIIMIDDGSTDNSGKMCDSYASIDTRLLVIHQENRGLSAARNVGIDHATGDYFLFVDSDDFIDRCTIQNLIERIECAPKQPDFLIFNYNKINEKGELIKQNKRIVEQYIDNKKLLYQWAFSFVLDYPLPHNKLYKRSLFDTVRFEEGRIHEDEFLYHRIIFQSETVVCVPEAFYFYRSREGSIMRSKWTIKRLDAAVALLQRAEALANYPYLWGAVVDCIQYAGKVVASYYKQNRFSIDPEYKKIYKDFQIRTRKMIKKIIFGVSLNKKLILCFYYCGLCFGGSVNLKISNVKKYIKSC